MHADERQHYARIPAAKLVRLDYSNPARLFNPTGSRLASGSP